MEDFSRNVKILAFAYDCLISQGVTKILTPTPTVAITAASINVRFLTKSNGQWKEFNSTSPTPLRSDNNYNRILARVRERAKRRGEVLVVKKTLGEIHTWAT